MDALAGASRGWVERYRKRQQELAEGVDADLVQANRLRTPTTDIQQQAVTAMSLSISKYAPNPGQECEGDITPLIRLGPQNRHSLGVSRIGTHSPISVPFPCRRSQ